LGFGQGLERENSGFSAMNLERESWDFGHGFRERELTFNRNQLQSPPIHLHLKPPSATSTFTLRECLRFSSREKKAWRLEIDKLEILYF